MKTAEEGDTFGKIYSMMGSLSNLSGTKISELKGVDISVIECLGLLFLSM
jgi:hypothetical protein